MPPITALLHTANDMLRLGRALETLLPCAEILIIDHGSTDQTRRIAARYGARILMADGRASADYLKLAHHEWILCLTPWESITESLQVSLFEWAASQTEGVNGSHGFSVRVREQVDRIWHELEPFETRLIPRACNHWNENLPAHDPASIPLEGELLRISLP